MLRGPIREAIDTGQPVAASTLERVSAQFSHRDDYADTLIMLAADATDTVSAAATWLIKHHLEQGRTLSPAQTGKLIENLLAITAWGAQLHVCQSIRFLDIPPNYATTLIAWLRPLRSHQRPFLRAWALDATYEVARQRENAMPEARAAVEAALADPAASVKARARNIARSLKT